MESNDNSVLIGTLGGSAYVNACTQIGAASSTYGPLTLGVAGSVYAYKTSATGSWATTSDRRDKADFKTIEKSLEFINNLEPVTFVDNYRDNYILDDGTFDSESYSLQTLKKKRRNSGFIAQDVYQSLINIYDDDNYASIVDYSKYDHPDITEDRYCMRYEALIPFLTGAIQELSKKNDELVEEIKYLKEEINSLKNTQ